MRCNWRREFGCALFVATALSLAANADAWAEVDPAIAKCQDTLKRHEVDAAIAACNEAVDDASTDRNRAVALNLRAMTHLSNGDVESAIADLNASIAIDVPDAKVFLDRANLQFIRGEYTQAFKDFDEAVRRMPANGEAYSQRGLAQFKRGDYAPALVDFEKAATLVKDDPNAKTYHAMTLFALGRFEEAAQALRDMTKRWMQPDLVLWTLAAEWRAGNLTSHTAEAAEMFLPPDEWPSPVAAYLTGSITAEELEKAAAAVTPREHGPTPNCQVAFYIGETSLSLGHDNAKARLLQAKKLCGPLTVEGMLAEAELKRITP